MNKIKIFTGNDLDSAGSLMILRWVFRDKVEIDYTISNIFNIKRDYDAYNNTACEGEYKKVFILNMIPDFEVEDNVFVFSKADCHITIYRGKIAPETTTTKLLRLFFKDKLATLSDPRIKLLNLIECFYLDNGSKRESMKLNALFNLGRSKYAEFYERFDAGIEEFTKSEKQYISTYSKLLTNVYNSIELFEHHNKKGVFIALISDMTYKHEILDLLFKKNNPKIVFLVDLDNGLISVRKSSELSYDMNILCDTLLQGRALKNCAGGRYTSKFIEFTKNFI